MSSSSATPSSGGYKNTIGTATVLSSVSGGDPGASGSAAYGLTPQTRWPHHDTPLRGLYLVGASTGLGPGIEAVMVGAATLAEALGAMPQRAT